MQLSVELHVGSPAPKYLAMGRLHSNRRLQPSAEEAGAINVHHHGRRIVRRRKRAMLLSVVSDLLLETIAKMIDLSAINGASSTTFKTFWPMTRQKSSMSPSRDGRMTRHSLLDLSVRYAAAVHQRAGELPTARREREWLASRHGAAWSRRRGSGRLRRRFHHGRQDHDNCGGEAAYHANRPSTAVKTAG